MPIFTILIVLALLGLILWAVNTYLPMQPGIKRIFNIVAIVAVVIWLLKVFGVIGYLMSAHI